MSPPLVISLLGLPGAGKTTLGKALAQQLGERCTYFGVGEALRTRAKNDQDLREQLEAGRLGPEELVLRMVGDAYSSCVTELLILDGFPRHAGQVPFARENFPHWKVLYLDVLKNTAAARLSARRFCARCGAPALLPEASPACKACGGETWTSRAEDSKETLKQRLESAGAGLKDVLSGMAGFRDLVVNVPDESADETLRFAMAAIT